MADRNVLKEFLVSLGFTVNQPSFREFFRTLTTSEKMAKRTGLAVIGFAVAAEEMVRIFAKGMEKLYYQSLRTKSSVEALQALRFAAQQVGVDADEATGALEAMSKFLRTQPGGRALLEQILGEPTENKENIDLFYALIRKLKEVPHEVGSLVAAQFGIDEKTFFMLKANLDALEEAERRRRQMNRDAGIDAEKAALAAREYMNTLRDLWEHVKILGDKMAIDLLPAFRSFAGAVRDGLGVLSKLDYSGMDALLDSVDKQAEKWGRWASEIRLVTDSLRKWNDFFSIKTVGSAFATLMGGPNWANGDRPDGALFPKGSPGYNAAARVLALGPDAPGTPSNEMGQKMVALGLLRRLYNSPTNRTGEDMQALEDAIKKHEAAIDSMRGQGFVPAGVTAPGAVAAANEGARGGPVSIVQHNEFNIQTADPVEAARRVQQGQQNASSELVRNLRGAHR